MDDFLPLLKKSSFCPNETYSCKKELFFCIHCDETQGAFVTIVNKKLEEIKADYHSYSGIISEVIKRLNAIREKKEVTIQWKGRDERIYLNEHNDLMNKLMRCPNLCNTKGENLLFSETAASLQLHLQKKGNGLTSTFVLKTPTQSFINFQLLSDSFALADQQIYPIDSLGENYQQLDALRSDMRADRLEAYLSIVFSYLENVQLMYDKYTVLPSTDEVSAIPTLVIDEVEQDQTWLMHLTYTLPNIDPPILEQFDLTQWATVDKPNRQILLRPIVRQPLSHYAKQVYRTIATYAPDTESKRAIFWNKNLFLVPSQVVHPFREQGLPLLLQTFALLGADKLNENQRVITH